MFVYQLKYALSKVTWVTNWQTVTLNFKGWKLELTWMHPQDMLSMKFLHENISRVKVENECLKILMSTILMSDFFTHTHELLLIFGRLFSHSNIFFIHYHFNHNHCKVNCKHACLNYKTSLMIYFCMHLLSTWSFEKSCWIFLLDKQHFHDIPQMKKRT